MAVGGESGKGVPRKAFRVHVRGMTTIEAAVAASIAGSLVAIGIPTMMRHASFSHFAEAVEGVQRLGSSALAHATSKEPVSAFPESAALTPAAPPRGHAEPDPQGAWDGATWQALHFRAAPEGVSHRYAFAFDRTVAADGSESRFVALARGDLDGDGVLSTFEIRGRATRGEGARLEPGMKVEAELE